MRRLATVALLIGLIGCGSSKTFTAQQVSNILPGKADTPSGLTFLPESSGEQPISQVSRDAPQETALKSYGFQKAYAAFYANNAAVSVLQQPTGQADPSAHVVAMLAEVFATADGAHKALALNYQKDKEAGTNIRAVSATKIGDETLAEAGTQSAFPFPGFLLYWRVGNAIFAVIDAGGPTAGSSLETAQKYAQQIQARVEKL